MKKKSIFNNNEVDIDLLFNQPKHLKKMFGGKKNLKNSGMEESEEDEDDEEEEQSETKSLSPHMKKYINDYIDSKKSKKKSKSALMDLSEKYGKTFIDVNDKIRENAKKHKGKGIIENFIKRNFDK